MVENKPQRFAPTVRDNHIGSTGNLTAAFLTDVAGAFSLIKEDLARVGLTIGTKSASFYLQAIVSSQKCASSEKMLAAWICGLVVAARRFLIGREQCSEAVQNASVTIAGLFEADLGKPNSESIWKPVHFQSAFPGIGLLARMTALLGSETIGSASSLWNQGIGTLNMSAELQASHKSYAADLWRNVIKQSGSSQGFSSEWYALMEKDHFPLMVPVIARGVITFVERGNERVTRNHLLTLSLAMYFCSRVKPAMIIAHPGLAIDWSWDVASPEQLNPLGVMYGYPELIVFLDFWKSLPALNISVPATVGIIGGPLTNAIRFLMGLGAAAGAAPPGGGPGGGPPAPPPAGAGGGPPPPPPAGAGGGPPPPPPAGAPGVGVGGAVPVPAPPPVPVPVPAPPPVPVPVPPAGAATLPGAGAAGVAGGTGAGGAAAAGATKPAGAVAGAGVPAGPAGAQIVAGGVAAAPAAGAPQAAATAPPVPNVAGAPVAAGAAAAGAAAAGAAAGAATAGGGASARSPAKPWSQMVGNQSAEKLFLDWADDVKKGNINLPSDALVEASILESALENELGSAALSACVDPSAVESHASRSTDTSLVDSGIFNIEGYCKKAGISGKFRFPEILRACSNDLDSAVSESNLVLMSKIMFLLIEAKPISGLMGYTSKGKKFYNEYPWVASVDKPSAILLKMVSVGSLENAIKLIGLRSKILESFIFDVSSRW